jgi:hypothetical protein
VTRIIMPLTRLQALARAGRIWSGLPHALRSESTTYRGYFEVRVENDPRTHTMDDCGRVTCGHADCLEREVNA